MPTEVNGSKVDSVKRDSGGTSPSAQGERTFETQTKRNEIMNVSEAPKDTPNEDPQLPTGEFVDNEDETYQEFEKIDKEIER